MPNARPWPTCAAHARDDAAEALMRITQIMEPIVFREDADPRDVYRRCSQAHALALSALRTLEAVGACTRPAL